MILTPDPTTGLVHVEFDWDPRFGECYDCGAPAAYYLGERAFGTAEDCDYAMRSMTEGRQGCAFPEAHELKPEGLRCSVCAAMAAVSGERLTYLFEEA